MKEIEFQATKGDYIEFYKTLFKNRLYKRRLNGILLLLAVTLFASSEPFSIWRLSIAIIVTIALYVTILYYIPLYKALAKLDKAIIAEGDNAFTPKKLSVTDDGLLIKSAIKTTHFIWEAVISIRSYSNFIYISLADNKFLCIPRSSFPLNSDSINFTGIVQTHIRKTRGIAGDHAAYKATTPPYSLGWLCVIPLIGGLVGLALILYGIFKYKNKKLIIIGAAGLLFTIFVYSALFYEDRYGKAFDEPTRELAQMNLNSLIKNIEFYKIQHGTYPDSIQQLSNDDKMAWINDPIKTRKYDKNTFFNYKKVGSHYYLFSSGLDGIPNTNDDLYPTVAKADSSKIGWIKK